MADGLSELLDDLPGPGAVLDVLDDTGADVVVTTGAFTSDLTSSTGNCRLLRFTVLP
jgi:hypothetical protein